MTTDNFLPNLPVVTDDTLHTLLQDCADTNTHESDVMVLVDKSINDILLKIEAKNPLLYGLVGARIIAASSKMADRCVDPEIIEQMGIEIIWTVGLAYGLLENQLQSDYLESLLRPKE
jgi:hypothetical protein